MPEKEDPILGDLGGEPSFALEVRSNNKDIRALLQEHLDLQRYRRLPDLSAGEIDNLMEEAQQDAADLLATQGYFNPVIRVSQKEPEGGAKPAADGAIVLDVALEGREAAGERGQDAAEAEPDASKEDAEEPELPTVQVEVALGPPARVTQSRLRFDGHIATALGLEETIQRRVIRQYWQLREGQRFTQDRWDSAKSRALRDLQAERYLAADLASSEALVDADKNEVGLSLTLNSGPVYHFGEPQIQGQTHYSEEMVRRFLRIPTGDTYSLNRLLMAQQRLIDTGFFDSVFLYMDPKADPESTPVQVQLSEARLQKLVLGVGASTNNGPRVSVEHIHNKSPFFGWRSHIKTSIDKREKNISANVLSQPDEDYWRWSLGAAHTQELDEDQDIRSQTLRAGRLQTNEKIDRSLYAEYNRSSWFAINPIDHSARYQTHSALSANFAWTARYFDSITYPTSGYGLGAELGAGVAFGENYRDRKPFTRVVARWQSYHPLEDWIDRPERGSPNLGRIQLRAQVGGVTAQQGAPVPAKLLFLTGGDGTVRGYPYRSLSAQDLYHKGKKYPQPGHYVTVASAEWQKPIYSDGALTDWESTWFVDTGGTAYKFQDISLNTGVGAGLRWRSPIGPFQADLAYGLKRKRLRLHLSVGFVF